MPSAIRDAIALAISQHADDRESVELVLEGWHYKDKEPLIVSLASLVGSAASRYLARDRRPRAGTDGQERLASLTHCWHWRRSAQFVS